MRLEEMHPYEVLDNFESFYEKNKKYYLIVDENDKEIGIFGIKKAFNLIKDCAEISIHIFKEYRYHSQYKKLLKYLLDFPFLINFNCIVMHTEEKCVKTLLEACKKLGVYPIDNTDKTWFYRRKT